MAVTSITPVSLALNTASSDLPDAGSTAIVTGADGFSIVATNLGYGGSLLLKFVSVTNAASVVITAGAKPPSMLADLGTLTITLAADDVKYVAIEDGRFTQADGTIDGIVTGAGADSTLMSAFILPRNL